MTDKRRIIARFQICSHLHAMSDFGFAHDNEPTGPSGLYSRPHTNNAECYAEECQVFATYRCGVPNSRGVSPHRGCSC
jgi:hypothetical protein